ncbi:matrilin-4 isoform X2 [Pan paniscus]|uniref:matrilin-4 isoform X2 n=1 Tax=Pan paniscus TaxID=9597 RepID=UPI002436FB31|nr:matrilin-4 isoform X1 [Pan paniscus]XP_008949585.2 matrilin-4 isoform X1 [Pan paniscus]XP_008949588.2 matrilin-4 isoform X1 [Pan paniscus]XP_034803040.2 matrilin-4 isoform X1 [Pan paniscus]XP_054960520.1 matrilin-4 isoform X1 [Pan paniscus]XP_054960521.1 matrilin-4 isoform X1 [Pan paniscus]
MRGLLCWLMLLLLLQPWETQLQLTGPRCHTGPLDLVFVIDSSRSVRPFEFETMRQFLMGLLPGLNVGPNATRVGVIQYSSQVQSVFPLRAFSRREDMERAIRDLVPLAQGTMTGLAIQYAMNVAFSVAEGARPPEERVPRVAVIVTDGRPQDRVAEVAAQARARGIEIYAVGVQRADVGSLRAMASPPLDEHVFLVESFDLIQEFGLQFQSRLCAIDLCAEGTHGCEHHCVNSPGSYFCRCQVGFVLQQDQRSCRAIDYCSFGNHSCQHECVSTPGGPRCHCREGHDLQPDGRSCQVRDLCNGVDHGCEFQCVSEGLSYRCLCPEGRQLQADGKSCNRCREGHVDLVLLVDGSKSVRPQNFELVKRFVNQIVDFLDVSPEGTRVGLVQFSSRVRTEFPLGRYGTAAEVKQAVLAVEYMERGTMTGLALRHMVEHSFSEAQGARPRALNVPRVGLVFTDGRSQDDISVWAARAKEEGIVMYAVGVGKAVEAELREIASEPAELHVSYAPDFGTMTHLLENLRGSICPEEGISAGTELRSPCECESLVEFQGRTLGALESLTLNHILWGWWRGLEGK